MKIIPVILLIKLLILNNTVYSAKILAIFSYPSKCNSIILHTIARELVAKGHEITIISNYRLNEKIDKITEIIIQPPYDLRIDLEEANIDLTSNSFKKIINFLHKTGLKSTEHALQQTDIKNLIKNHNNSQYDLIIVEQFYQEAFLMLSHLFNAPIVAVATSGFSQYLSPLMGAISPWAYVPHELFSNENIAESFTKRLKNVYYSFSETMNRQNSYLPAQDHLAKTYFSTQQDELPSIHELERKISIMLINSHITLTTPRPRANNMIEVGGLHIAGAKGLPRDIRQFLDEAHHGAILLNLGTNSVMTIDKVEFLFKIFQKMKHRILWKWDNELPKNIPKSILMKSWLPQSDILAHPHVRLLITNGNLLSMQEAVYRSVPMLNIPFHYDQQLNAIQAADGGYGITLSSTNLTELSLQWAIQELIINPIYSVNIDKLSKIYRDRPVRSLDEAIYWIEYVLRYNGANHLQSSGPHLPTYKYYLIDMYIFILFTIISTIIIICLIIKFIIRKRVTRTRFKKII